MIVPKEKRSGFPGGQIPGNFAYIVSLRSVKAVYEKMYQMRRRHAGKLHDKGRGRGVWYHNVC